MSGLELAPGKSDTRVQSLTEDLSFSGSVNYEIELVVPEFGGKIKD